MSKVAGSQSFMLDGIDYGTKSVTIDSMGGKRKESETASGKITGRSETPMPSRVTVTYQMTNDTDLETIRRFSGSATYRNDIGQVYSMKNADVTEPPRVLPGNGGVEVTLEGDELELIA